MSISKIARSLNKNIINVAFNELHPDFVRVSPVKNPKYAHLLSDDPLTAGKKFHRLLRRLKDNDPLSAIEGAYFPWVSALRREIFQLGGEQIDTDVELKALGVVPRGTCDLLIHGGPAPVGVIEAKVITRREQETLRGRDLAQLAAYARLVAGRGSFDHVWVGLAYIELETRQVRLAVFENSRPLVLKTLDLLRAA